MAATVFTGSWATHGTPGDLQASASSLAKSQAPEQDFPHDQEVSQAAENVEADQVGDVKVALVKEDLEDAARVRESLVKANPSAQTSNPPSSEIKTQSGAPPVAAASSQPDEQPPSAKFTLLAQKQSTSTTSKEGDSAKTAGPKYVELQLTDDQQ